MEATILKYEDEQGTINLTDERMPYYAIIGDTKAQMYKGYVLVGNFLATFSYVPDATKNSFLCISENDELIVDACKELFANAVKDFGYTDIAFVDVVKAVKSNKTFKSARRKFTATERKQLVDEDPLDEELL